MILVVLESPFPDPIFHIIQPLSQAYIDCYSGLHITLLQDPVASILGRELITQEEIDRKHIWKDQEETAM